MFEALVERLLNKILGQYIENFSAENLKIGIWSGEVILRNVVLKRSIIKKLNLPFNIKYSRLGCLKMNIPWKSLTSSKIEILLEGFELIISQIPVSEWECKDIKIIEKRKKEIQSYCEAVLNDFTKKSQKTKQNSEQGYFSKLVVKIIDNLQVTIKDIHVRYQDQISKAYSFGVTLEELKLYTVNKQGKPQYIDRSKTQYENQPLRKQLQLYNIGIYWNQVSQFYPSGGEEAKMSGSIAKRNQTSFQHNYVILMSSQAKLLQRQSGKQFNEPEVNLDIDLQTLKIEITNNQLQQIIVLAQRLQRYTQKVKEQNRIKLTQQEMKANRDYFLNIFPEYYNGWGKNIPEEDQQKIENILYKMEVEHFTKGMNAYLQSKEKQRIIKEKKEKNKGWWFGSPKQLTSKQIQQIQLYLNDNFGQEVKVVKRPEDYHYINVIFRLERLQVVIANTLAIIKQGIQSTFDELLLKFKLREGGFMVQLTLQDIAIRMFKQIGVQPRQYKQVLYKLTSLNSKIHDEYLKMIVIGNPLDKKYLNTEIKLTTSELMMNFDPKIITIATEFASLNISNENKEAAIEKFGQIKEKTAAAVADSIEKPTKKQIGVDVTINSITVAIPFHPSRQNQDCWGVNLGSVHFTSDQEALRRMEIQQHLPLDVYNLQLNKFSFRHYKNINHLKHLLETESTFQDVTHAVINNLDFQLRIQLYHKATETIAKAKLIAILPTLQVNINEFTYKNLLKVGAAFEQEEKILDNRVTSRINEKKEIQGRSSKIGIVHIKDSITKIWKKYIAIMSENYIYLYVNKSDKDYAAYYYIKGATLQKFKQPLDKEKPYYFRIKNKLNQVVLGFDKQQQIEDWMTKIRALQKQSLDKQLASKIIEMTSSSLFPFIPIEKKHNELSLIVFASIQSINVNIFTSNSIQNQVIQLSLRKLSSEIYLHQSKKIIYLKLFSIDLKDTIQKYKYKQLTYFLATKHENQSQNLINIQIEQLNKDHPKYNHSDSEIKVNFGTLICNYKCQTVKTLMGLFIPADEGSSQQIKSDNQIAHTQQILVDQHQEESFTLQLSIRIKQISVLLVNQKIKTVLGNLGITDLILNMGMSQKRMSLNGSLRDMYYNDWTNYPSTIIQQCQQYKHKRTILTANIGEDKNMLTFDIQILKRLNQNKKNMIIDIMLANLTTYFVQQPVLRIITYLNTQMLPSFQTGSSQQIKSKQSKALQAKNTRPEPATMELKVQLTNISVFVQTKHFYSQQDKLNQQFMQLNIERITVFNSSIYKQYVESVEHKNKPIVLVENYFVKLYGMSIFVNYFDSKLIKHSYQLTNKLNFGCSTDLIANPEFYVKQYGNSFKNGLRVQCTLSTFFMRMNHDDFNFIMKCLNWSITHDDGTESLLFDLPVKPQLKQNPKQSQKQPFYLDVKMDSISLAITDQNIPIAFLLLDQMIFTFQTNGEVTVMDLLIKDLKGSSIQHNLTEKMIYNRGMFNLLGYSRSFPQQNVNGIQSYKQLFDKQLIVTQVKDKPFLKFQMKTTPTNNKMNILMSQLIVDVDVKLLMILINLANIDQSYVKSPEPMVQKIVKSRIAEIQANEKEGDKDKKLDQTKKQPPKGMQLYFNVDKLLASVSDRKKTKFIVMQSAIDFQMKNSGQKTKEQLQIQFSNDMVGDRIYNSQMKASMKHFTLYFCKITQKDISGKRQFLKPMNINFQLKNYYHRSNQIYVLSTDIYLETQELLLTASIKDMLNVNYILNDNLKTLADIQPKTTQEQKKEQAEQKNIIIEQRLHNKIQTSTKINGKIAPIQIEVVNDCGNNFMPVFRLLIQGTEPFMHQFLIKKHIIIVPIISLHFFNPRSSKWQPIIEAFKATIDYLVITTKDGQNVKFLVETNSKNDEMGSLKINISTQMISTIIATKDIAQVEKENIDKNIEAKQIEISPFIFQNITNEKIYLNRQDKEFQIEPLFKGPIRLTSESQITFRIKNHTHKFSLDHYGVLKIPQSNYFIKYDTEKLNRIIKFIPVLMIKNKMHQPIYIKRQGNVSDVPRKVQIFQEIPLDNIQSFAVSLNGTSYTEKIYVNALKMTDFLIAEKKNFLVLLNYKQKLNKYAIVQLIPPFVINNCLPKPLSIQFIQKAKTIVTKKIEAQHTHEICASQTVNSLQFKILVSGYTWSKKFKFRDDRIGEECQLELEDQDNATTVLNFVFEKTAKTKQYRLTIYCKKIIINELGDKLVVYGNNIENQKNKKIDKYSLLGGQRKEDKNFDEKLILIGDEVGNKLRVCGADSIFDFATPILIGGIGSSSSRIVVDRDYQGEKESVFTVIGVEISAIKMSKECDIFCKKIVLKSKVIIINNSSRDLTIMEEVASNHKFQIKAGIKDNFVFGLPDVGRKHKFTFKSKGFFKSKLVYLPEQGTTYFKLESKQMLDEKGKKLQIFFKIYIKEIDQYSFYDIKQITQDDFPYEVLVKSSSLRVNIPSINKTVAKGEICRFINQNPLELTNELQIQITHLQSKDSIKVKICPDDLKFKFKDLIRIEKQGLVGSVAITVEITIGDKQKIILVDELHRQEQQVQIEQSYICFNISEIILSINQNSEYIQVPYQSIVLTLRRIVFIKNQSDKKNQFQLKLGFMQIDQAFPHTLSNPVVLTPYKFEQFTKELQPSCIFNSVIVFSKEFKHNTFIKQISVDFNDIVTNFSVDFINLATNISKQFGDVANFKEQTYIINAQTQKWRQIIIPEQGNKVYIKSITIAPFVIELSADLNIKKLNLQNNLFLSTIMSAFGVVMSNIDNAPVSMTGIKIDDCIDTVDSITKKLVDHYKRTCINQFYKIFGSLNIIGNPLSLFRNISTGFKDLTQKPAKGFVNGPAEFGLGIAQGTGSLVAHSVGGAFNSLSKVTGTVSTSLATLAFDKDFEQHREKQKMKKPQNVLQGLEKGGKAVFYGFKQGITGVFMQPYQNARKQGALGFMKGAAKGLAGLVVKPVTGIIDFASKTTEGIKNNALMFEDKPNQQRMRYPRVFYSQCFILKQYCKIDSQLYAVLKKVVNEQKFNECIFIECFAAEGGKEYLVILQANVVYIDVEKRKILWQASIDELGYEDNKLKKIIYFKNKKKGSNLFSSNDIDIFINSDKQRQDIIDMIQNLQKQHQYNL